MDFDNHSADSPNNLTTSVSSNRKPVVLMVGDYLDARPELKEVLTRKGYSVIDTDNGQEATQQARRNRPDLLLVDLDVPLLYELVAARQIVKNAQVGLMPVVIVTHDGVVDPMPLIEVGANRNEYVTRLLDYAELQPLLDYLLPVLPRADDARLKLEAKPTAALRSEIRFD